MDKLNSKKVEKLWANKEKKFGWLLFVDNIRRKTTKNKLLLLLLLLLLFLLLLLLLQTSMLKSQTYWQTWNSSFVPEVEDEKRIKSLFFLFTTFFEDIIDVFMQQRQRGICCKKVRNSSSSNNLLSMENGITPCDEQELRSGVRTIFLKSYKIRSYGINVSAKDCVTFTRYLCSIWSNKFWFYLTFTIYVIVRIELF